MEDHNLSLHPLRFFDVNCGIGPYFNPPSGHDPSAVGLLQKMDELGIAEAAVYHFKAQQYDFREGNPALFAEINEHQRLKPVLLVGPHHSGEAPTPDEITATMKSNDARILKMHFGVQPFVPGPDPFLMAPLFDKVAPHRPVLILEYADVHEVQFNWIVDILNGWPGIKIVLVLPKIEYHERYFYALWERFDGFFVELAGDQTMGSLEAIVEKVGSGRVLYGSRYPYFTPLQTMLQIIYAEIDDDAKRGIAGDNLRNLLKDVIL